MAYHLELGRRVGLQHTPLRHLTEQKVACRWLGMLFEEMRTLRHPGVIKVLDTVETDILHLSGYGAGHAFAMVCATEIALSEETCKWGLYTVANTLSFINDEAASVHGNVRACHRYI